MPKRTKKRPRTLNWRNLYPKVRCASCRKWDRYMAGSTCIPCAIARSKELDEKQLTLRL